MSALTKREVQVLQLAAFGLSNAEIGERLGLTANTIKTHLARIAGKRKMGDRTGLACQAIREGLIA